VEKQNSSLQTHAETDDATLDPDVLDRYVGVYAPYSGEFGLYTITRAGVNLVMQVTGQPSFELYSRGGVEFAPTVVDARVTFLCEAGDAVTGLVLRQAGAEISTARIDSATAEQFRARLAARIENKERTPGSEAALRRLIDGIRAGAPDYEEMSPAFARLLEHQVPRLKEIAQYLGAIRSLDFRASEVRGGMCTRCNARTDPAAGGLLWAPMGRSSAR